MSYKQVLSSSPTVSSPYSDSRDPEMTNFITNWCSNLKKVTIRQILVLSFMDRIGIDKSQSLAVLKMFMILYIYLLQKAFKMKSLGIMQLCQYFQKIRCV